MSEFAITYDKSTGVQVGTFMCQDGMSASQEMPPNTEYMAVPSQLCANPCTMSAVQSYHCNLIDASADAVAAQIVNLSPRRVQTSMAIKEESDLWTPTSTAPTPFLSALAAANGTTVQAEKTLFDANWAAIVPPGALINATAEAAKRKVSAATNLAEIAAAATINWSAVMATLSQP